MSDIPTLPPPAPSLLERVLDALRRITIAQAIVIAALIAAGVCLALWLPDDRWGGLTRLAVLALTGGGVAGTALLGPRPTETTDPRSPTPSMPPPLPRRRNNNEGSASVLDLVLLFFVLFGAFVLMPLLHGCAGAQTVKPALVTACGVARVACGVVESACGLVDGAGAIPAPSSGGETAVEVSPP
jgi:hypothetical protein